MEYVLATRLSIKYY